MSRDMQCTPSSLARHFRQSTEAAQQGRVIDSTPPCNGCTACCRSSHMKAAILDHERADFPEAVYDDAAKRYVLPKRADGSCIHLVDEKCTVYAKRPYSCRIFDCRMYAMAGINIGDCPLLLEVIASWDIKFKTPEDREVLGVMRATTARMVKAGVKSQTEIVRAALTSGADHMKRR